MVMPPSPCAPQWEPVQYFNNKINCDLVEEKFKGIISILVSHLLLQGLGLGAGRDDVTSFPSLSQLDRPVCRGPESSEPDEGQNRAVCGG